MSLQPHHKSDCYHFTLHISINFPLSVTALVAAFGNLLLYIYFPFHFFFFTIGLNENTVESSLMMGSGVWLGIKLSFLKWQGADLPRWQRVIGRICWQMDTRTELAGCCRRQNAPSHRSVFLSNIAAGKVSLTHSRTAGVWIWICSRQTLITAFLCRPNWYHVKIHR